MRMAFMPPKTGIKPKDFAHKTLNSDNKAQDLYTARSFFKKLDMLDLIAEEESKGAAAARETS